MQYLLVDSHKRFLGTYNSSETFAVGDTFQDDDDTTYAVIGLNWSRQTTPKGPSLTVMPLSTLARNTKATSLRAAAKDAALIK
jgi:hypothetical protein